MNTDTTNTQQDDLFIRLGKELNSINSEKLLKETEFLLQFIIKGIDEHSTKNNRDLFNQVVTWRILINTVLVILFDKDKAAIGVNELKFINNNVMHLEKANIKKLKAILPKLNNLEDTELTEVITQIKSKLILKEMKMPVINNDDFFSDLKKL